MDKVKEEDENIINNNLERPKLPVPASKNHESTSQPKRGYRNGIRPNTTQNGDPIYWVKTGELGLTMGKTNDDKITDENPKFTTNSSPALENRQHSSSVASAREAELIIAKEEDVTDNKQATMKQTISKKKAAKVAKEGVSNYVQRRRHVIKWKDTGSLDQDGCINSFSQSLQNGDAKVTLDTVPELSQLMQDLASK